MNEQLPWQDKVIQLRQRQQHRHLHVRPARSGSPAVGRAAVRSRENTGGRMFQSNAPAASLRQIVKEASAFYLLGYAPPESPADGKFHRIKVRVKRPGVDVRARSGYFAPTLAELESARKAVAEELPPEISHALATMLRRGPTRPARSGPGVSVGRTGNPRVTISWEPRDRTHSAKVMVTATGADGQVVFDGPLVDGTAAFDAPARAIEGSPDRAGCRRCSRRSRRDLAGDSGFQDVAPGPDLPDRLSRPHRPGAAAAARRPRPHAVRRARLRAHRPPAGQVLDRRPVVGGSNDQGEPSEPQRSVAGDHCRSRRWQAARMATKSTCPSARSRVGNI